MSDYLEAILIGAFIGVISFMLPWFYKKYVFNRHSQKIISFIKESKYTFRSIDSIVEGTQLKRARVEEVCKDNKHIIQNKKTPNTWRVL